MKHVQKERLKEGKNKYRMKIEDKLWQNNVKEVRHGLLDQTPAGPLTHNAIQQLQRTSLHLPPSPPPPSSDITTGSSTTQTPNNRETTPTITPGLTITADQVKGELRKLHTGKAAGPDGISPMVTCADELGDILAYLFNLSLKLGRVPELWKTSCLIPVPKKTPH
ncbi:hypothetical protein SKAU_G00197440 [Synaphobranchus kaupii]|uniref:Reverse transcriptase n=1 Tax=Synaphobranchus kaupii TaxID=118154 RepID=A0A9Q1IY20_SYNKA|nr:hypothetical protein SKAU_G00197440 [Synaphobranchus kaupii]